VIDQICLSRHCLFGLTFLCLVTPQLCSAAPFDDRISDKATESRAGFSQPTRAAVRDVRLESDGKLQMTIVDPAGQPMSDAVVTVGFRGQLIARMKSDGRGQVVTTGLRPGLHTVSSVSGSVVYRLWDPSDAPPSSLNSPALIVGDETARGQYGPMMGYPMQPMMGPPMMAPGLLATGVTAAAVAAVIVGKNSGSGSSAAPPASP
jgi:hypothetical protein